LLSVQTQFEIVTNRHQMNIKRDIGYIIRGITELNNSSYSDVRITSTRGGYTRQVF